MFLVDFFLPFLIPRCVSVTVEEETLLSCFKCNELFTRTAMLRESSLSGNKVRVFTGEGNR